MNNYTYPAEKIIKCSASFLAPTEGLGAAGPKLRIPNRGLKVEKPREGFKKVENYNYKSGDNKS